MNTMLLLTASFASGALLGLAFFWGLWATVKQLGQKRHPVLMILGSLVLRFGLVLIGFYLLTQHGGWQPVLSAAVGFTLIRVIMVHRLRPATPVAKKSKKESAA
jgi:F1F0 ATPase subunit 2